MKKIISKILLIITILAMPIYAIAQDTQYYLSKDAFIPIHPTKTLSTSVYEEGDVVYFIVPSDLWIDEFKIIPKNSIVKANIDMLKMPITGINATLKIKTKEIIYPTGERYQINGSVAYKGEKQIGGNLTPPLSYNKALHPRKGQYYNGVVAQYVPSGEYEFGQHITIMPNEILHIILEEDFIIH